MPMDGSREERWVLDEKYGGTPNPGFEEDRHRLAAGEPVAYVIGHTPFLGLTIRLDSHPLIPRSETEWWTERMLKAVRDEWGASKIRFLDLCSGSGAIGCAALARLPQADVHFGELDGAHEATIRANIRENGLDGSRAHVGIGDLFEPFPKLRFEVIASNPPYIPAHRVLDPSVADFEPPAALFAGNDGLAILRRIARELPEHLSPDGQAWIECDHANAKNARALFESEGFATELSPDQHGILRLLVVRSKAR